MTETGFLAKRSHSPVSLGAAFAVQGVILAGLVTMAPQVTKNLPDAIKTIVLFTPTEPPVNPPDPPKPMPRQPDSRIDTVKPLIPTQSSDARIVLPDLPPINPGAGTQVVPMPPAPIDPPKPDPVFVGAQVDPRFARALQPDYPGQMKREGREGKVTVRVLVGTDGRVKAVEQVSADAPAFFQATQQQAMKYWRFKPATRDGVAVESWRTMTVRFEMAE